MNDHDDSDLRFRLRGLPREMTPPDRVWAAVAEQARRPRPSAMPAPVRGRRRWPLAAGMAVAASIALAVALVPRGDPRAPAPPALVQQAEAIRGEYRLALASLPERELPPELQPAIDELDEGAAAILDAIREAPSANHLLGHLQRTYARRLELTSQATFG